MSSSQGAFSAFNFAVPRPARRMASSGSFRDEGKQNGHAPATATNGNGPTPIDHPSTPTLGAWEGEREQRDGSLGSSTLGHSSGSGNGSSATQANGNGSYSNTDSTHQRSFSSILSPALPTSVHAETQDPLAKPFVYSREFLLSLYDEDKASKKPIELASHEIATTDGGGKPWALREWRNGEKELFSNSIHPPSNRSNRSGQQSRGNGGESSHANGASGTLDLSTLPTLPRDRERSLNSTGSGSVSSPPRAEKDGLRRARGALGSGSGMGIMGGALGGIPGAARTLSNPAVKKEEAPKATSGAGAKEVWQGGRWRRGGTAEAEEEKRPSAFGARKYPADTVSPDPQSTSPVGARADDVPNSWDDDSEDAPNKSTLPTPPDSDGGVPNATKSVVAPALPANDFLSEPDLAQHASSILGSLALDSDDLTDDPLASSTNSRSSHLPPGLSGPPTSEWQYRDTSRNVQGPFAPAQMHDWYTQKFFTGDLPVKRTQDADFETLDALILRSGDKDQPFLTAPLQPVAPLLPPPSAPWPLAQSPAADQFANVQRPFASFYEPFSGLGSPGAFDPSRQQPQQGLGYGAPRSASGGLDPWGAPLPPANIDPGFGQSPGWAGEQQHSPFGQQQPQHFQQQQQHFPQAFPHSPADLFRQAPDQQHINDPFGRQPASPFFDPSQLSAPQTSSWNPLNGIPLSSPQAPFQQQIHQQSQAPAASPHQSNGPAISLPPIGQNSWSSLMSPASHPLPPPSATVEADKPTAQSAAPPVVDATPAPEPAQAQVPSASVWDLPKPVEAPKEVPVADPVAAAAQEEVKAPSASGKKASAKAATPSQPAAPVTSTAPSTPAVVVPPPTSASPAPKVIAPWVKEEEAPAPGPSLRQIQEAEAKQAELRKTAERQAAARAQALAAVQAAQRAAAAEAESLPSSSTWAASPSSSPAPKAVAASSAPWLKGAKAAPVGKTLKEIQDEEEKRKKAVAAVAAQSQASTARGYAGSIASGKAPASSAPWTTVAVKPAATPVVPATRPIIPGGPVQQTQPRVVNALPAKPVAAPVRAVLPQQTPSRPASRGTSSAYDADSPPPPSADFLKWCKEALKGLTVPMDEFIQMLLSFPLDASSDILEIISDSVYANSSTLDGRRFANDFTSRRKLDVSSRFPNIAMSKSSSKTGKPSSMADALKAQPAPKTPEWNVKVAGSKKKKGAK